MSYTPYPLAPDLAAKISLNPALILPKTRAALGKVAAGTANMKILCVGNSTTIGYAATNSGSLPQMEKPLSWPGQLSGMFNGTGVNSHFNSLLGNQKHSISLTAASFDNRISTGAGWTNDAFNTTSLGGDIFFNSTTTNALSFTPTVPVDTFKLYYPTNAGLGTFSYDINGGTATNINANTTAAFASTTVTCPSLGINTCNIKRVSGNAYFIGWEAWDSSKSWVSVINSGWTGSTTNDWNTAVLPFDPANAVKNIAADLTLIDLGINDWIQAISLGTFKTNIQTLITNALVNGDCALISPNPSQPGGANNAPSQAIQQTYVNTLIGLANTNNIPIVDIFSRELSYTKSNSLGFNFDDLHFNGAGYRDIAQAIFNVVGIV